MEKLCSEIKTDKAEMTIKHPRELKKLLEKKKKNSKEKFKVYSIGYLRL